MCMCVDLEENDLPHWGSLAESVVNSNEIWDTQKLGNVLKDFMTVSGSRRTPLHTNGLLTNNSCVSDYLQTTLDNDLRMRVGAAILAENHSKNPNAW